MGYTRFVHIAAVEISRACASRGSVCREKAEGRGAREMCEIEQHSEVYMTTHYDGVVERGSIVGSRDRELPLEMYST